jgi:hypothetical protein
MSTSPNESQRRKYMTRCLLGMLALIGLSAGCKNAAPSNTTAAPVIVPVASVERASLSNELTLSAEFIPKRQCSRRRPM